MKTSTRTRSPLHALIVAGLTCITLLACAKPVEINPDVAEQPVPLFHMALNGGNVAEIYSTAAPELKQHESQQDFVARLEKVRAKMGPVQGTERQSWKAVEDSGSVLVTLTYKSRYAAGEAEEEFLIRMKDGWNSLAGYKIKARQLD
ncbi:DUF4019 domain-containing protein [Uliginosibacterium sp. H3]|uniref:DUF4019 domain-containing protein n=1 Tax=Uliginosibacterium silvisoli TaxID=3114758 RepID=A0ABU6JZI2_9RHOO|nr:DUF4019 domain-containing protein [Uliginosibacterium sp. H3]